MGGNSLALWEREEKRRAILLAMHFGDQTWWYAGEVAKLIKWHAGACGMFMLSMANTEGLLQWRYVDRRKSSQVKRQRQYKLTPAGKAKVGWIQREAKVEDGSVK